MIRTLPGAARSLPTRSRRPLTSAVLALAAGTALLLAARSADAHARLERSVPEAGAVLPTSPATIELWFNELLDDDFNDVTVLRAKPDGSPADEHSFASAKPAVDATDRTHLTTPVATLAPGAYVVQWKVLSRDGHSARGRVLFRIGAE